MSSRDPDLRAVLEKHGLNEDTLLYRYSLPEFVTRADDPVFCMVTANPDPSEAVIDIYGEGHIQLALHAGAGLAFGLSEDCGWKADDRTCVALRLGDALDQGGRVYPVRSITTEPTFYVTLPEGRVRVRRIRG